MLLENEFFSLSHVITIGRRKMLLPNEETGSSKQRDWEVYVRLMTGSTFTAVQGLTKKKAMKKLREMADNLNEATGCLFVTTDDDFIIAQHVARIYVDTQENERVTVIEDTSGASYVLTKGSEAHCRSAAKTVADTILQYIAQQGG